MSIEDRNQIIIDTFITAVEGGINYWASLSEYSHKEGAETITVWEDSESEEGTTHVVVPEDLRKVFTGIRSGKIEVAPYIAEQVKLAYVDPDSCDIDADVADVIFQIAIFGQVVFG
jgi:hypothetical protein